MYETVKELMKLQNIVGEPQDFIPGYKKELETVTKMRLKEVSPAVAQYVRAKKLKCIFKHGDGTAQLAAKHGKSVQSNLTISDAQLL